MSLHSMKYSFDTLSIPCDLLRFNCFIADKISPTVIGKSNSSI